MVCVSVVMSQSNTENPYTEASIRNSTTLPLRGFPRSSSPTPIIDGCVSMKIPTPILTMLFASFVFLISVPLHAEVLFDSTDNPIFDLDTVNADVKLKASFTTNESQLRLSSLTLRWRKNLGQKGIIRILLLDNKNELPGVALEDLATVDADTLTVGDQWLTIPLKNAEGLKKNTRYWIEIAATGESGAMAYSRQHHGVGVQSESYLNNYGLHRNTETGPYIFKLEGIGSNP